MDAHRRGSGPRGDGTHADDRFLPPATGGIRTLARRLPYADARIKLWKRGAWLAARPLELRRSGSWSLSVWTTHPSGDWLVASTADFNNLTFWPLRKPYPTVVDGCPARASDIPRQ